ncbi:GUN4 domain-containing protein [Coleofasciculus sp. LEGE 07092]|uniref:GUN4 domain-containing protein n=1 Tax=Coleofasciculus sp. LEGE 07092 TaxID=2777969 RepID=UPI00187EC8D3|nr:GUN4 domain-containing protein [Coleofasciculus sp. LEGE 07092]MBE9129458.1 GUN4 domain-containing protein [Coleofasciculus sp. LEGE 07081]MBE9152226.1 GUN4 domain-containing protein [Coleofasciculus sp. LEGE 07092]
MTDKNVEKDLQFSTQLSEIKTQLNQLNSQLSEIKTQLNQLPALSEQVSQFEENLMLISDIYRYEKLRHYLAADNWFEADLETIKLIMEIAGETDLESITPEEITKFSCNALQVIDRLWVVYSKGHFGFSIQLRIYQNLGGNLNTTIERNTELIENWGQKLGWRENNRWKKCDELDYTFAAPVGCHPSRWWNSPYGSKMTNYFLSRLITCQLD